MSAVRMEDANKPRNIVILLDGTGNQFGGKNSNLIKLMSVLKSDESQLVYYSSGLGTVLPEGTSTYSQLKRSVAEATDKAVAWNFNDFVCDAYQYLIDHYQTGDKVYLFGFSRGAYTARALAGMIQRVGLLSPGNYSQIPLAYEVYTGPSKVTVNNKESDPAVLYRRIFGRSRPVTIEFLGVWDTVSSLGGFKLPTLPFASGAKAIKRFRQALALDERRARFAPEYWRSDDDEKAVLDGSTATSVDQPLPTKKGPKSDSSEVWFMGCHSDVGGGNVENGKAALANIPFRWMLREAVEVGLLLDAPGCALQPALSHIDHADHTLDSKTFQKFKDLGELLEKHSQNAHYETDQAEEIEKRSDEVDQQFLKDLVKMAAKDDSEVIVPQEKVQGETEIEERDVLQDLNESLTAKWQLLEYLPLQTRDYEKDGARGDETKFNMGYGRQMIPGQKIHKSVLRRIIYDSKAPKPASSWWNSIVGGGGDVIDGRKRYVKPAATVAEGMKDWKDLTEKDENDPIWEE